jgi:hypothetical protein
VFYQAHTEAEIAELESYKLVWKDEFEGASMSNNWATGFVYPSGLEADHSHVSEQQAYTKGQNTKVACSVMTISTKKQAAEAKAWHPMRGMHMHDFAYTSDVWHTVENLNCANGVLQAKVEMTGDVKHTMVLTMPKMQSVLPILHPVSDVKGYLIYTLVWNEKEAICYVNDQEVARSNNTLAGQAKHILLRSYLPEGHSAGAGELNVDWIRVYSK